MDGGIGTEVVEEEVGVEEVVEGMLREPSEGK